MSVINVTPALWAVLLAGLVVAHFDHKPGTRELFELARSLA